MKRGLLVLAVSMAACKSPAPPLEPFPPVNLVLQPGRQDTTQGLFVTLIKVENDSRCPTGVQCVWQGDAAVHVGVSSNRLDSTAPMVLHTGVEPRSGVYNGYQVRLDSLTPAPRAQQPIAQGDYRAWVSVRFLPD